MPGDKSQSRRIYVGLQKGVCAVSGHGDTWIPGDVTPLAHASARTPIQTPTLTASRPTPVTVEPYTWAANLRLSTVHQMAENPGRNELDSQQCQNLISGDSI